MLALLPPLSLCSYVTATAAAKILRNISAPTKMLHLSNIPEGTTEAELRQLFQTYGERLLCGPRVQQHLLTHVCRS